MRDFVLHNSINNLDLIKENLKSKVKDYQKLKIIAVTKTFEIKKILPLIEYGHLDYGENKVQEAINKWSDVKSKYKDIKLHLIGKLQTNKVKFAIRLFDYVHSVDNERLAKKISEEQQKQNKKIKVFIQVNIGNESQKSGIQKQQLDNFYYYCKTLNLDVIGLMCIPPVDVDTNLFFQEMEFLTKKLKLSELSMGMSSDYLEAAKKSATYLRIGSSIFGNRD